MATDVTRRPVREVMRTDFSTLRPHSPVHEALHVLLEGNQSVVPVVNRESRYVGLVSLKELAAWTHELVEDLSDLTRIQEVLMKWLDQSVKEVGSDRRKVASVMRQDVPVVRIDLSVGEAVRAVVAGGHECLPVVDEEDRLVGLVQACDLLRVLRDAVRSAAG